jgi:hypothetical protein
VGIGFAVHLLWVTAVIFFFIWLVGFAIGRGKGQAGTTSCVPLCATPSLAIPRGTTGANNRQRNEHHPEAKGKLTSRLGRVLISFPRSTEEVPCRSSQKTSRPKGLTAAKTYTTAASTLSWRLPTYAGRLTCVPGGCAQSRLVTKERANSFRKMSHEP